MPASKTEKNQGSTLDSLGDEGSRTGVGTSTRKVPQPRPAHVPNPGEPSEAERESAEARYAAEAAAWANPESPPSTGPLQPPPTPEPGDPRPEAKLYELLNAEIGGLTAILIWDAVLSTVRSIAEGDAQAAKSHLLRAFEEWRAETEQPGGTVGHWPESFTEDGKTATPAGVAKQDDKTQAPGQKIPVRETPDNYEVQTAELQRGKLPGRPKSPYRAVMEHVEQFLKAHPERASEVLEGCKRLAAKHQTFEVTQRAKDSDTEKEISTLRVHGVSQAQGITGLSRARIQQLPAEEGIGELIAGRWMFSEKELRDYMARRKPPGRPPGS